MLLSNAVDSYLDRLVRPRMHLFGRTWLSFHVFGLTGLAFAILLSLSLTAFRGLSPVVTVVMIVEAQVTFLALAMAAKILVGEERLIYYHQEIAVTLVTGLLLKLLGQPVLTYLDIAILGVGAFLAFGRIGCLMVGCCHGGPNRWGVRYGYEHALDGFPPYLVGVRLFPVQAVESLMAFAIVLVGSTMVLSGQPPGAALSWYVIAYGVGRFCLESLRGDPVRLKLWGFSEAQWTSLLLMATAVLAELAGTLPFRFWHILAVGGIGLSMLLVAAYRRGDKTGRYALNDPRHVRELANALERAYETSSNGAINMERTSLGIQVSAGQREDNGLPVRYYTISSSSQNGPLTPEKAAIIARLILELRHPDGNTRIVTSRTGIYHLLIKPAVEFTGVGETVRSTLC